MMRFRNSLRKWFSAPDCLIETMQEANGWKEGERFNARRDISKKMAKADQGVGTQDAIIACDRCKTSFSVLPGGAVVVKAEEISLKGLFMCTEDTGTPRDGHVITINLDALTNS